MINIIITVFMGLLFVVPLIYAIECKIQLNIEKDKCDYWRQKSMELNYKNSEKRFKIENCDMSIGKQYSELDRGSLDEVDRCLKTANDWIIK